MRRLLWLTLCAPIAACSGGGGSGANCDTAKGTLPAGLTTISFDSPGPNHSVRGQGFYITYNGTKYSFDTLPLTEAVRFQLTKPATIYGYTITWANLVSPKSSTALEAGLYPDFGF